MLCLPGAQASSSSAANSSHQVLIFQMSQRSRTLLSLVSTVSPVPKTCLCTDTSSWLLWVGAGQKARHRWSFSLTFGGLRPGRPHLRFPAGYWRWCCCLGGQGPPREGCGALCWGGVSYLLLPCPEEGKFPSLGVMFIYPVLLLCK